MSRKDRLMRHRFNARTSRWFATAAMVGLLLTGCAQAGQAGHSGSASVNTVAPSGAPLHLRLSSYRVEFNTPASMCTVPLIATGSVSTYLPAHWNTANDTRPSNLTPMQARQQGYMIYTPMTFDAFKVLQDRRSQPTREFVAMGGQAGQDTYSIDEYPRPQIGQQILMLFVHSNHAGQPGYFQDMLVLYETFPIDAQGNVLLQQQTIEQGQVAGQNVTISLSQLVSELGTCPKS